MSNIIEYHNPVYNERLLFSKTETENAITIDNNMLDILEKYKSFRGIKMHYDISLEIAKKHYVFCNKSSLLSDLIVFAKRTVPYNHFRILNKYKIPFYFFRSDYNIKNVKYYIRKVRILKDFDFDKNPPRVIVLDFIFKLHKGKIFDIIFDKVKELWNNNKFYIVADIIHKYKKHKVLCHLFDYDNINKFNKHALEFLIDRVTEDKELYDKMNNLKKTVKDKKITFLIFRNLLKNEKDLNVIIDKLEKILKLKIELNKKTIDNICQIDNLIDIL